MLRSYLPEDALDHFHIKINSLLKGRVISTVSGCAFPQMPLLQLQFASIVLLVHVTDTKRTFHVPVNVAGR